MANKPMSRWHVSYSKIPYSTMRLRALPGMLHDAHEENVHILSHPANTLKILPNAKLNQSVLVARRPVPICVSPCCWLIY
jgi:hypothetical protein